MKKTLLLALFILLLIVLPVYGITARIGNSIMILRPDVQPGETKVIEKSIFVSNVNNVSINITMEPDENLMDIIEVEDKEFVLQPGESRDAKFVITLTDTYTHSGRVLVSFTPEKGPGVKLSSKITVVGTGPKPTEEVIPGEEQGEPQEEIPPENTDEPGSEVDVSVGSTGNAVGDKGSKNPNPVVGIIILLSILFIGVIVIFIVKARLVK